jgi:hypothetical protein
MCLNDKLENLIFIINPSTEFNGSEIKEWNN